MDAPKFEWNHPPAFLILDHDEVHVWRATLDLPPSDVQALEQILAADERARDNKFHFKKDRTHFVVASGIIRAILGRYLLRVPHLSLVCLIQLTKPDHDGKAFKQTL